MAGRGSAICHSRGYSGGTAARFGAPQILAPRPDRRIAKARWTPRDVSSLWMENFRLKVFRVVASHLNFSRAAEELLLTQPAVTQQIKALEDEYGVSLFDRRGGRIRLTPAGQALLPYAEKLRKISEEAYSAVAGATGMLGGQLVLGASQTIGQYLLPNLVAGFLRQNPRVRISAVSGNTDTILESLVAHRIQLAMVEGPAHRKDVHTEPFMEDEMVLVVAACHEWADREIELDDLRTAPLLTREFGSGSRRVVENALHRAGLRQKDLNISMELDSTEGLLSGVEAGLGVTFVSRWAARTQLALGTLKLARVRGLRITRMFSVAYPAGPVPTGAAGEFRLLLLASSMKLLAGEARGRRPEASAGRKLRRK